MLLRSLSLGSSKLAPPANRRWRPCSCPTSPTPGALEACDAVTTLSLLGPPRLRRLALRCCHKLAAVAVDSAELQAFEYRGSVPRALIPCLRTRVREINLLHYQGGTAQRTLAKFLLSNAPVMDTNPADVRDQRLDRKQVCQHAHLLEISTD